MSLYEIQTGHIGESYVRCYVWAENEKHARDLFEEKHTGRTLERITYLMSISDSPFCTNLSDTGWDNS